MTERADLYTEVTARIIAELEAGRLPWVKPWDGGACAPSMPTNGHTGRAYSGVNVMLLWITQLERSYQASRWVTFKQALELGGNVRKGEKGTCIVYADRFIPKAEQARAQRDGDAARMVPFLKRYTVFNVAQCDNLPADLQAAPAAVSPAEAHAALDDLVKASGAVIRHGGNQAFYAPGPDVIVSPVPEAFVSADDYRATLLHELTHWTAHPSRLDRDCKGAFGSKAYGFEELVAEIGSAYTCAALGIAPQVRHADYIGSWLDVLKEDNRAIIRAASQASKAADFLLAFHSAAQAPEEVLEAA